MKTRILNTARLSFPLATALAALLSATALRAADTDGTWLGTSGDWGIAGTWNGGIVADGIGFTANFTGFDIAADEIITLDTARTIGNITFTDNTTSSNNLTISGANTLTLDVASGASIIDVTQVDRTLTISSDIAGADGLTKNGSGTLRLDGNNLLQTGATTVTLGTLAITNNNALGTTAVPTTVNGGNGSTGNNLSLSPATSDLTLGENINLFGNTLGRANLINNSIQSHTLNGNIDVSSDTNASQISSSNIAGSITINGNISGTFTTGGSFLIRGGSTNTNNRILGDINITGGNFTKTDTGTWFVGSPLKNYVWGDTRLAVGTLILGKANIVAGTGQLVLGNSAGTSTPKLDLNGFNQTYSLLNYNGAASEGLRTVTNDSATAAVLTINNSVNSSPVGLGGLAANSVVLTGNLGLIKDGIGNLTLSGVNTYTGSTTITAGALILNNANPLGTIPGTNGTSAISMAAGGTLQSNAASVVVSAPITLSGAGDVNIRIGSTTVTNLAPFTLNGAIGGTTANLVLTNVNALANAISTIVLGAGSNYAGNTTLTAGAISSQMNIVNGVNNALPVGTILTIGTTQAGEGSGRALTYELNGKNQELAGLKNDITLAALRRHVVTNSSGTLSELTINNATAMSFGGARLDGANTNRGQITGNIALTKDGVGTFTLGGALFGGAAAGGHTFTGATKIVEGTLNLGETLALQNSAFDTTNSVAGNGSEGLRTDVTTLTLGGLTGGNSFESRFTDALGGPGGATANGGYNGLTALTLNPGTGATLSYSGDVGNGAGSMTLTKSGAGIQTLSGTNTYTGATQVNGGILNFASKASRPSGSAVTAAAAGSVGLGVSASDAAYYSATDVANMFNTNSLANYSLDPASGVAIDTTNSGGLFDQNVALTAARALTKLGTNTLRLSTNNTFTGGVTIIAGNLELGNAGALNSTAGSENAVTFGAATTGSLTLAGNSVVISRLNSNATPGTPIVQNANGSPVSNATLTVGNSLNLASTFAGVIQNGSGGGILALTKDGTNTLTLSGANTYSGATAINAGTLILNNATALGVTPGTDGTSGIAMSAGTILRADASTTVAAPITLSGAGDINLAVGTTTAKLPNFTGGITGATGNLIFTSQNNTSNPSHVLTLGATSNYTGNTTITVGNGNNNLTIRAGGLNSLSPTTVLTLDGGGGSNTPSGRVSAYDLNGNNQTLAGLTNTTLGHATSRNQRMTNSGPLATLTINNSADYTFGGATTDAEGTGSAQITGAIALTKSGAGTFTLAAGAANTYTGDTTVTQGTLAVTGTSIANTGKLVIAGGKVDLTNTETVNTLFFGGVQQAAGNYTSADPSTNFTGLGTLTVLTGPPAGYSAWATINGASLTNLSEDHDNDGVDNGTEYFIGGTTLPQANTTGFTALPSVVNTAGVLSVTWTKAASYTGTYGTDFVVETSATLTGSWTPAILDPNPGSTVVITGNDVKYTFPAGTINFARLKVTGP